MRKLSIVALALVAGVVVVLSQVGLFGGSGHAAGPASDAGVPPGFTRVTHIFHGNQPAERIVEHGPGRVPPPRAQDGTACPEGGGTDQCTTNSWSGNNWFTLPVEWSLNLQDADPSETETDSEAAFEAAFIAASDTWENDSGSAFDATYLGRTTRKASSVSGGPSFLRMDGSNDIDFGNLGGRYGNAIAVVIYWYFTDTGEIVEADMRMNQDYPWTANVGFAGDPDTSTGNACCFDAQNIATHEFGHFHAGLIDLTDNDESKLTMYGFGSLGELKNRTLALGDQLSIAAAYPTSGTSPIPTPTPTAASGDPTATPTNTAEPTATPTATPSSGLRTILVKSIGCAVGGPWLRYTITVVADDVGGDPVEGATVSGTRVDPSGTTFTFEGDTNDNGQLTFRARRPANGDHVITVEDVVEPGFQFDPTRPENSTTCTV